MPRYRHRLENRLNDDVTNLDQNLLQEKERLENLLLVHRDDKATMIELAKALIKCNKPSLAGKNLKWIIRNKNVF